MIVTEWFIKIRGWTSHSVVAQYVISMKLFHFDGYVLRNIYSWNWRSWASYLFHWNIVIWLARVRVSSSWNLTAAWNAGFEERYLVDWLLNLLGCWKKIFGCSYRPFSNFRIAVGLQSMHHGFSFAPDPWGFFPSYSCILLDWRGQWHGRNSWVNGLRYKLGLCRLVLR